ncbi:type I phosphomannose isomerase catalytic subunit [Aquipuribacter nitratireducens]|uniref:Type I phosphomannose isomerase catalytic subunit n=1 Tax=Aquipuribacter nitratireducens TaxID=650104 RepID=A0ABW0GRJ0_9MICO
MEHLAPLLLSPLLVPKPWGGRRLGALGRSLPDGVDVGESWDVVDLDPADTVVPDSSSRVAHGPLAGATLHDLVREHRDALLGTTAPAPGDRFPLLVKHLDAREPLSVQVHPPAAVLDELPGARLKCESWVVVAADPGAHLAVGLRPGTTPEQLAVAAGTPEVTRLLRWVPARVGEVHHVPPGTVHALGAGVVVAEPQTPSDTTYRLYDWSVETGRTPRPLHTGEALACVRAAWEANLAPADPVDGDGVLVETERMRLSRTTALLDGSVHAPQRLTPRVVVVVSGELRQEQLPAPLGPGAVVLLPAAWGGTFDVAAGTTWLDVDAL